MTAAAMTEDDVVDLIARKAGLNRPALGRPMALCDLRLSLEAYFAIVAEIEDRFDIEIDDLVAVDCATLGGLVDRLLAHVPVETSSAHLSV